MTQKSHFSTNIGLFFTIMLLPKALHALGVAGLFIFMFILFVFNKVAWLLKNDKDMEERFGSAKTKLHTDTKRIH